MIKYYNLLWLFLGGILLTIIFVPDYKLLKDRNGDAQMIKRDIRNGSYTTYYPSGDVKTVINYNNGIKHGDATMYHPNGEVLLKMHFINGKREGKSEKYYKSGALYALTPYSDNKITGVRTTYFENGSVKAKIPYKRNMKGIGLEEYSLSGDRLEESVIRIESGVYRDDDILKFSIDNCSKEQFYIGRLEDGAYLNTSSTYVTPLPSTDGYHYAKLENLRAGDQVICSARTNAGNPYVAVKAIPKSLIN